MYCMLLHINNKTLYTDTLSYEEFSFQPDTMNKWVFLTLLLVVSTFGETDSMACPEIDVQYGNRWIGTAQLGSWEECGTLCSADENCKMWTWDARYETCFLYERGSATPCDDEGVCFSGERGCPE